MRAAQALPGVMERTLSQQMWSALRTQPKRLVGGFVLVACGPAPHFQNTLDVLAERDVPLRPVRRKHCENSDYEVKERTFVHPDVFVFAIVDARQAERIVGDRRGFIGRPFVKERKVEHQSPREQVSVRATSSLTDLAEHVLRLDEKPLQHG